MLLFIIVVCIIGLGISLAYRNQESTNNENATPTSYYDLNKFGYKNGLMAFSDTNYVTKTGIDVSSHQEGIDWEKVKKDGISFAMIRCGYRGGTEGKLYQDTHFITNMEGAKAAGLKVGVYWFSSAISEKEAKEEADYVLNLVKYYKLDLPITYDMEPLEGQSGRIDKLTKSEKTKIASAFTKRIQAKGYKTLIYGNVSWLTNDINLDKLKSSEIWLASYSKKLTYTKVFTMWQYTQEGSVDGISGSVDINMYIQKK